MPPEKLRIFRFVRSFGSFLFIKTLFPFWSPEPRLLDHFDRCAGVWRMRNWNECFHLKIIAFWNQSFIPLNCAHKLSWGILIIWRKGIRYNKRYNIKPTEKWHPEQWWNASSISLESFLTTVFSIPIWNLLSLINQTAFVLKLCGKSTAHFLQQLRVNLNESYLTRN